MRTIMKIRGFEPISKYLEEGVNDQIVLSENISEYYPTIKGKGLIFKDNGTSNEFKMPARATSGAAGYDIFNNTGETIVIEPGETVKIATYIKSYMLADEVLTLYPRSGHGFKYLVRLANTCGIIDMDYYNCIENEGHIFIKLTNPERSGKTLEIPHGEAMCQGIFTKVLFSDDDAYTKGPAREGGIGSTSKKVGDEK